MGNVNLLTLSLISTTFSFNCKIINCHIAVGIANGVSNGIRCTVEQLCDSRFGGLCGIGATQTRLSFMVCPRAGSWHTYVGQLPKLPNFRGASKCISKFFVMFFTCISRIERRKLKSGLGQLKA